MLGRKTTEQVNARISSIVGEDMVVEGNITAKDAVRIEGTVKGDVKSEGTLVISATGKVVGNVTGSNIMVAGSIEGDLLSDGRIEVAATGKIIGNIRTKSLIVDENAIFQGQCTMNAAGVNALPVNEKSTDNGKDQKKEPELTAAEDKSAEKK